MCSIKLIYKYANINMEGLIVRSMLWRVFYTEGLIVAVSAGKTRLSSGLLYGPSNIDCDHWEHGSPRRDKEYPQMAVRDRFKIR